LNVRAHIIDLYRIVLRGDNLLVSRLRFLFRLKKPTKINHWKFDNNCIAIEGSVKRDEIQKAHNNSEIFA